MHLMRLFNKMSCRLCTSALCSVESSNRMVFNKKKRLSLTLSKQDKYARALNLPDFGLHAIEEWNSYWCRLFFFSCLWTKQAIALKKSFSFFFCSYKNHADFCVIEHSFFSAKRKAFQCLCHTDDSFLFFSLLQSPALLHANSMRQWKLGNTRETVCNALFSRTNSFSISYNTTADVPMWTNNLLLIIK